MPIPNPQSPIPPSCDRRATLAVCGLLVLAVGLVFGQTARFSFVDFDDDQYVYANSMVCHGLTAAGVRWAFTTSQMSTWHPLTWLSLMLECRLFRLNAGAYHLTSALLHAATAVLLFVALRRMTRGTGSASGTLWPSALAAAVFAVHPLRAESVAWVTERKDVLAGLFFALTLLAYERYARRPFSLGRYAAVMLWFALGLLSKSIVVTVPFLLLLLDYWPLGRLSGRVRRGESKKEGERGRGGEGEIPLQTVFPSSPPLPLSPSPAPVRRVIWEKVPLLAMAALAIAATLWAQGVALSPNEQYVFSWRLRYVPIVYVTYLARLFWPAGLAVLYPRPGLDLPLWQTCDSLALLLAVTALALILRRRCPYLLVGWLWYLGMSVPIIGFLQFGVAAVADRFTYLPEIGLAIALAFGAADALWRGGRAGDMRIGRVRETHRFAQSVAGLVRSTHPTICGLAAALGLAVLAACGWRQTSFWHDSEMLWTRALACTSKNDIAHNNLGFHLAQIDRTAEAMDQYKTAIELNHGYAIAHLNLGCALTQLDRCEEAVIDFRKALELDPELAEAHTQFGVTLTRLGRYDDAIAEFQEALRLRPDHSWTLKSWGEALRANGDIEPALARLEEAARIEGDNPCWGKSPETLRSLAAVYADLRRFHEARDTARTALDLAKQKGKASLAARLERDLVLYRAGKPAGPIPDKR